MHHMNCHIQSDIFTQQRTFTITISSHTPIPIQLSYLYLPSLLYPIYLSIYLSIHPIYLSTLSIYLSHLSIYLIYLSIHPICLPYHEYKVRHCWGVHSSSRTWSHHERDLRNHPGSLYVLIGVSYIHLVWIGCI